MSNDNAYAGSLFRTCKYRPNYTTTPLASVEDAQGWMHKSVRWDKQDRKHSGLKFVTPTQRHSGQAAVITVHREHVYRETKSRNPWRWTQQTRN